MLCRESWVSLDGTWEFASDEKDQGVRESWFARPGPFNRRITVPFPPESPASGVGDRGIPPVVWYRRSISPDLLIGGDRQRIHIHFGAVDFRAQVWFDGQLVGSHVGGQTPFTVDVTPAAEGEPDEHVLVVRAEDYATDLEQPRGKQDWRDQPHGVWYERTTGIWQTVWAETVPENHITDVAWIPDVAAAAVHGEITVAKPPPPGLALELTVRLGEDILAELSVVPRGKTTYVDVPLPELRNSQDRARMLWTPEHPTLLDIEVVLRDRPSASVIDLVASYTGMRSVSVGRGSFQLNGQPCYLRAVLNQGYRPQTHLAAEGPAQLRAEVELIREMGFNAVRVHQKAEDPRFLFWADRLGLMVWAETAAAYVYSPTAVTLLVTEWMDLIRRDRSHPSIVTWVPLNESWGVPDIASRTDQQNFARSLASLTRALDPGRPVVSNDGWEHVDSDILGLHDYAGDANELRARYGTSQAASETVRSARGPLPRRPVIGEQQLQAFTCGDAPLMITEFGGISLDGVDDGWGYTSARSDSEYATLLQELFGALRASRDVAGFCYTQFMDTGQETNGLLFADRTPKLPLETIRQIVTGVKDGAGNAPGSTFGSYD
ncbi:MAG TPA: glycoside hydrolase family 2 TIM barrel-domain containing protein [Trebonia sp.]